MSSVFWSGSLGLRMNSSKTSDLCDAYGDDVEVCCMPFQSFGRAKSASGFIKTLRIFEDAALLKRVLQEPGANRILVVDAGGSMRAAVLGDHMANIAIQNGWIGLIIHGAIRDAEELASLHIGILALGAAPRRGSKTSEGEIDGFVEFGGVRFSPGDFVCFDPDGVVMMNAVSTKRLQLREGICAA